MKCVSRRISGHDLGQSVCFMKGAPGSDGGGSTAGDPPRRMMRRSAKGRVEAPRGCLMGKWPEGHYVAADRGKWGVPG